MMTDLVIDQEGEGLCISEAEKNAVGTGPFLSKSVTHGAVSDCFGGEGQRIAWTGRCHTSLLTGKTQFPSNLNLKSTQVKRFLSKMSLKVSGVVSRQYRRLRSVWETNAKARGGREGHHGR